MKPKIDPALVGVAFQVIRDLVEHGTYGSDEKARAALKRRTPRAKAGARDDVFAFFRALLPATIAIVARAPRAPSGPYTRAEDFDAKWIVSELRSAFPDRPDADLETFVAWVIYQHHLR